MQTAYIKTQDWIVIVEVIEQAGTLPPIVIVNKFHLEGPLPFSLELEVFRQYVRLLPDETLIFNITRCQDWDVYVEKAPVAERMLLVHALIRLRRDHSYPTLGKLRSGWGNTQIGGKSESLIEYLLS